MKAFQKLLLLTAPLLAIGTTLICPNNDTKQVKCQNSNIVKYVNDSSISDIDKCIGTGTITQFFSPLRYDVRVGFKMNNQDRYALFNVVINPSFTYDYMVFYNFNEHYIWVSLKDFYFHFTSYSTFIKMDDDIEDIPLFFSDVYFKTHSRTYINFIHQSVMPSTGSSLNDMFYIANLDGLSLKNDIGRDFPLSFQGETYCNFELGSKGAINGNASYIFVAQYFDVNSSRDKTIWTSKRWYMRGSSSSPVAFGTPIRFDSGLGYSYGSTEIVKTYSFSLGNGYNDLKKSTRDYYVIDKDGYDAIYQYAYSKGNKDGYNKGYDAGIDTAVNLGKDGGIFGIITAGFRSVTDFLNINVFGSLTLGTLLLIPITFGVLMTIIKLIGS